MICSKGSCPYDSLTAQSLQFTHPPNIFPSQNIHPPKQHNEHIFLEDEGRGTQTQANILVQAWRLLLNRWNHSFLEIMSMVAKCSFSKNRDKMSILKETNKACRKTLQSGKLPECGYFPCFLLIFSKVSQTLHVMMLIWLYCI